MGKDTDYKLSCFSWLSSVIIIDNKTGGAITDTNSLSPTSSTGDNVVYAANGPKHRETEAGPTVNLNSATSANWD
jgi:hypothetical protein